MTEETEKKRGQYIIINLAQEAKAFVRESGEHPLPDELLVRAAVAYNMLTRDYGGKDSPGPLMRLNADRPEFKMEVFRRAHAIALIASNFADAVNPSTPERAALFAAKLEALRG